MIHFISAERHELSASQYLLAERLMARHGDVYIAREANGVHFYMASPIALEKDGDIELHKRHLAVNATKAAMGDTRVALCMKYKKAYDLKDLLTFPPLSERGIEVTVADGVRDLSDTQKERMLEIEPGVFIPHYPGKTTPLTELPEDHPAITYLRGRNFDPVALQSQFQAAYCYEETALLHYASGPGGFSRTPQGRLVLYIYHRGEYRGWQARFLERDGADGWREYFHPYEGRWVPVFKRDSEGKKVFATMYEGLDLVKYYTAPGTSRNRSLMGYDAAAQYNAFAPETSRFIGLTEGPLDAGRLGPPFCATLGKYVSATQLKEASKISRRIVYVSQNDDAAAQAREGLRKTASTLHLEVQIVQPPNCFNDVGDMTPLTAEVWVQHHVNFPIFHAKERSS